MQVQLYPYAANIVLGENAKTGAVHLLKEENKRIISRIEVPITDPAIQSAINNIQWAVGRILGKDFSMRPSESKCSNCDFNQICAKQKEDFSVNERPSCFHIPEINGINQIMVRCFSDL